jgi:hypothetical protein
LRKGEERNPQTTEARTFVEHVESLFMPWNIDALVDGFTDDCIVRFGTVHPSQLETNDASEPEPEQLVFSFDEMTGQMEKCADKCASQNR